MRMFSVALAAAAALCVTTPASASSEWEYWGWYDHERTCHYLGDWAVKFEDYQAYKCPAVNGGWDLYLKP